MLTKGRFLENQPVTHITLLNSMWIKKATFTLEKKLLQYKSWIAYPKSRTNSDDTKGEMFESTQC